MNFIIKSHWQHTIPWFSIVIRPDHQSLLVGPPCGIHCLRRNDVYESLNGTFMFRSPLENVTKKKLFFFHFFSNVPHSAWLIYTLIYTHSYTHTQKCFILKRSRLSIKHFWVCVYEWVSVRTRMHTRVCVCMIFNSVIRFTQPLRSDRMWHKVNF